jgi:hypothetical protein
MTRSSEALHKWLLLYKRQVMKASSASDDIVWLGKAKPPCICVGNIKGRPRLIGVLNERQMDIAPARRNVRTKFGKPLE